MNRQTMMIGAAIVLCVGAFVFFGKGHKGSDSSASRGSGPTQELFDQALTLKNNGQLLEAKKVMQDILTDHADFEKIDVVEKELEDTNLKIIFSDIPTEQTVIHEIVAGDTLGKLAQQYGTTVEFIKKTNHISNDVARLGQKLRIWTGTFNIFVDKSQNILILKSGEEVVKVYSVSTGANNSTPVGEFKIVSKLVDPVWFNKGMVVPPESPKNVLGSRWMGFDLQGYGIHGTIEPQNIGQQVTAGCVRMRNEDVEELYSMIPMGTKVKIVD